MEIFIIRDGKQTGPYDDAKIQSMLSQGSVLAKDNAWRKGLPAWLPLSEVLQPDSTQPPASPGSTGRRNDSSEGRTSATAKQKALLKYLDAESIEGVSKEEAATAISDALENPKFQDRINTWHQEKLRLHPTVFQDEIDYRTANRTRRYLEQCQTEGAEVVKDVTKAHVQVLVESLDKRFSNWESEPRAALWDYLFPSIAEHFPALVLPAAKGRLRLGVMPKMAAARPRKPAVATLPAPVSRERSTGAFSAAVRGGVFGLIVLGIVAGAMKFWLTATRPPALHAPPPAAPAPSTETAKEAIPANPPGTPGTVAKAPENVPGLLPSLPPATPPAITSAADEPAQIPPSPVATPPVTESKPAVTEAKPAIPPAPAPAEQPSSGATPSPALPSPVAPAAPSAPRTSVTLIHGISVSLPNGQITLPAGTQLRYLALEGQKVRVAWNNNLFYVPAIATDVNRPVSEPATPAATPATPAVQSAVPGTPAVPRKPGDDL
jgi:hypothetical protein